MRDNAALADMAKRVDELPLLPTVLIQILKLDPNAEDYFESFVALVQQDPPFAVRVVALANSPAYKPVHPVVKVQEAVSRLGSDTVRNLVASMAVQRVFVPTNEHQLRLWSHSICTAVAARFLASHLTALRVDPDIAYLCGLLHDIGRFVMFEHAPEHLLAVDESNWQQPEELVQADVEVFTFTHSQLGYRACKHWGLPDNLAEVVRDHHQPGNEQAPTPGSVEAMVACVRMADAFSLEALEKRNDDEHLVERVSASVPQTAQEKRWLNTEACCANVIAMRTTCDQLQTELGLTTLK